MAVARIDGDGLARALAATPGQHLWFLGAGTSAAANVPTATDMIVDFKTTLFCAAVRLSRRQVDPSDPLWRERIEAHFDGNRGIPGVGAPDEYSATFEAVHPSPSDRRRYIDEAIQRARPSFGHRVLASLVSSGRIPCLITTNFDPLIERSVVLTDAALSDDAGHPLTVADLQTADRATRCVRDGDWPLLVKIHGDYQSEHLKNTTDELRHQDAELRAALSAACQQFGLVVIGYSGRDDSVMEALMTVLDGDNPYAAGIYWCTRSGPLLPAVDSFLERADASGVRVSVVEIENFDELAGDLARHIDLPAALAADLRDVRPKALVQPVALPTIEGAPFPVLRLSALPILELPARARAVRLSTSANTRDLRAAIKDADVRALAYGRGQQVAAFGADEDLLTAFGHLGGRLDGEIELDSDDSGVRGLLYDALTRALASRRPLRSMLRSGGHSIVVRTLNPEHRFAARDREQLAPLVKAYNGALVGTIPKLDLAYAEGVRIRLERHEDRWWCVFDPYTWIDLPRDDLPPAVGDEDGARPFRRAPSPTALAANDWRRERWAPRFNTVWAAIIDAWAGILAPDRETTVTTFGLRDQTGIDARFVLRYATGWCRSARTDAVAVEAT